MKSVIEEGPSIAKAIEQGWIKAGKPKEFSIKIFQEPKKNFLGMTTIVAKVGIFFRDSFSNEDRENKQSSYRNQNQTNEPYQQRPYYKKRRFSDKNQRNYRDRNDNRRRYNNPKPQENRNQNEQNQFSDNTKIKKEE